LPSHANKRAVTCMCLCGSMVAFPQERDARTLRIWPLRAGNRIAAIENLGATQVRCLLCIGGNAPACSTCDCIGIAVATFRTCTRPSLARNDAGQNHGPVGWLLWHR